MRANLKNLSWARSCLAIWSHPADIRLAQRGQNYPSATVTKLIRHSRIAKMHVVQISVLIRGLVHVADSRGTPAALARPMMDSFSVTLSHVHLVLPFLGLLLRIIVDVLSDPRAEWE